MKQEKKLVLLQALQMRKPVIITKANAVNGYIQNRKNAISINNTKEELLAALKELYTDEELYNLLATNGKDDYNGEYSAESNVINTAKIICEI